MLSACSMLEFQNQKFSKNTQNVYLSGASLEIPKLRPAEANLTPDLDSSSVFQNSCVLNASNLHLFSNRLKHPLQIMALKRKTKVYWRFKNE
jgi:hypothetical protein